MDTAERMERGDRHTRAHRGAWRWRGGGGMQLQTQECQGRWQPPAATEVGRVCAQSPADEMHVPAAVC